MTGTDLFLLVLGWIFVIEGLSPLINPVGWQRMLAHLAEVPPERIRSVAATVVRFGLAVVWLVLD